MEDRDQNWQKIEKSGPIFFINTVFYNNISKGKM